MSSLSTFIIRKHRPYLYIAILTASVILSFFVQRYFYLKTTAVQQQKIKEFHQLEKRYNMLHNEKQKLISQLASNKTILADNRLELNLQKETIQQLEQQLGKQQEQLATLNKELLFYQTITQGDRPNKLQIRELRLRIDNNNSDIVHYQLVITQGKKINKALTGTVDMISKTTQGESTVIAEHPLNLRHVQVIEGQLQIIDKQVPENIIVTIKQKKKTLLSQSFPWQLSPPIE